MHNDHVTAARKVLSKILVSTLQARVPLADCEVFIVDFGRVDLSHAK
jgi:hypothetical protein